MFDAPDIHSLLVFLSFQDVPLSFSQLVADTKCPILISSNLSHLHYLLEGQGINLLLAFFLSFFFFFWSFYLFPSN